MLFKTGKITVRVLDEDDKHLLVKWLSNPSILEFYEGRDNPFDLNKVTEVFYDPEDETVMCIVQYEGKDIGYVQFYSLDTLTQKEYGYFNENIYGMDQFIGETQYCNKGIGSMLVSGMVSYLLEHEKAERIVMDRRTGNMRAIKCYEKCGFIKVKKLPNHELHEGEYHDCWLMEYQPNFT
ncbi:GNAT family N-acetyltransferase [Peribacillus sp. SCS-155]|uniref:GNAT family N-acetyltransferase n=1 Tax=Peribacillus sedimenti TaxID=3115297 RepID=UPI0039068BC6